MKKRVFYILIIFFIVAVLSGILYIFLDKDSEILEDKNNEKKFALSMQEIYKYISYLPDMGKGKFYKKEKSINGEEMEYSLISGAITVMQEDCRNNDNYDCVIFQDELEGLDYNTSLEVLNKFKSKMMEMYNYEIELQNSDDIIGEYLSTCYKYNKGYFIEESCYGDNYIPYHMVDDVVINQDELIIYDYVVGLKLYFFYDYYKDEYMKFESVEEMKKLEENKENFTKYKHTFKKNDTGYYWYMTEVA